ncbi:hypothetical protein OHA27_06460 [Streptomyces sp. NBC_01619]|uniref:Uncharacterized protein n=1 Tax=Streptomyces pratisoli TaxID=3139917 RepID=A0ACC6QCX4_9ACTN|nr:hypothetical protein [Streptomyces sp. NBC_01619]MCX4509953.1 hypothetical protein [Streptomyces sp. NBC_01619]
MTTPTGRRTPRADCIADSAGGITFDMAGIAAPAAAFVLRRRGGTGAGDTVRLPLTPAGGEHSRAVLPSTVELAEGYWDAYTDDGVAIEPGIRDLRALLGRVPEAGRVAVRVPCPTADGRLAVRCWLREPHAEAGDIGFEPGACTVEGVLYGAVPGEGAVAEARLGGTVHQVPVTTEGGGFAFTLPYEVLAEQPVGKEQLWTLWLRPAKGAEPVRISRVLDDVWDRSGVYVYPAHTAEGYRATPCYTAANDLCVRMTPTA